MIHGPSSSKRITSRTNVLKPEVGLLRPTPVPLAVAAFRPTILIVDDDSSVAGMLKDALTSWGYDVVLASNGQEGLSVLGKQNVDGILLDINMPVMGGRTMLDEMRWLGYQTPVAVMSGGLDIPTLRQLVKEGAQGFTVKPYSLPSLRKLCKTVFDSPVVCGHSDAQLAGV